MPPEQPGSEHKRFNLKQVAGQLGWSPKRVRAYYRAGIFPKPIREPGDDRGGFWYQEAIDWMLYRRDHVHEFRLLPAIRAELAKLLPAPRRSRRGARPKNDAQ